MSFEVLLANLYPFMNNLIGFIIMITVIVFIHEFGHFYFARLLGVRVEIFSIGFGKSIVKWKDKKGTSWQIGWLPMGGYVKMYGDTDGSSKPDMALLNNMSAKEREESFYYKSLWKKSIIVFAGPFANFVLAIVIMFYLAYSNGVVTMPAVIGEVVPNTPAAEVQLKHGDLILQMGDKEIHDFKDVMNFLLLNNGESIVMKIQRNDEVLIKNITPVIVERDDGLGSKFFISGIGIVPDNKIDYRKLGLGDSFIYSINGVYNLSVMTLRLLGQMVTGSKGFEGVSGPIKIARFSGKSMSEGFSSLLQLIAFISVNLGLINLLPIPLLDGGHLASYVIRAVYGRPLPSTLAKIAYRIAFIFLAFLMLFTIAKDIVELFR